MNKDYEHFFKQLEKQGVLRDEISSLGWGFWTFDEKGQCQGFMDEHILRVLADEIERRNKPFWDEYDAYCASLSELEPMEDVTFA